MLLLTSCVALGASLGSILSSAGSWSLAIGGIGLVVFVHELGHFLVAKRCGVRVEIFSLGFGPRLLGLRRGDTDYRLSLVPIGGYVKMAGDNPGDAPSGDGGDLPSKSVAQRFAIFAAGVAMNLVFALVALPIVLALGVSFTSTRIGAVQSGGPAWRAGISEGDEVVAVGGHRVDAFEDVVAEVALSGSDGVAIELSREADRGLDGAGPRAERVFVQPEYDESNGRFVIGILPSLARTLDVVPGGAADRAGITEDDVIVAFDGDPIGSAREFERRRVDNRNRSVTITVRAPDGSERDVRVDPAESEQPLCLIGIRPYLNTVRAVRGRAAREGFLEAGDQIVGLERVGTAGASELVVPVRDHDEFTRALGIAAGATGDHRLAVIRDGRSLALDLPPDADPGLAEDVAFATEVTSRRVRLMEGYPAALAGIADGAEIVRVDRVPVADWAAIKQRIESAAPEDPDPDQRAAGAREIEIVSVAAGVEHVARVTPRLEYVPVEFGLVPVIAVVERSYPLGEAVGVGISSAGYMLKNVYLTLKKILVREVSASNLSGILTIAYVSRSLAESGVPTLFFFLAVLSLNLAFLNLLPIPILDGGHLFFLVVEKIKGSPVSERVLGFSQLVGLVLVLALLLFVTYNDLRRLFS